MADTRSKYIPPDRASASYLGEEGGGEEGRGKNVGSSDDRREQSVYRANAFRGHRRGRIEDGEKKVWSRRDTMDGLDGSLVRCFIYADREGRGDFSF